MAETVTCTLTAISRRTARQAHTNALGGGLQVLYWVQGHPRRTHGCTGERRDSPPPPRSSLRRKSRWHDAEASSATNHPLGASIRWRKRKTEARPETRIREDTANAPRRVEGSSPPGEPRMLTSLGGGSPTEAVWHEGRRHEGRRGCIVSDSILALPHSPSSSPPKPPAARRRQHAVCNLAAAFRLPLSSHDTVTTLPPCFDRRIARTLAGDISLVLSADYIYSVAST